MKLIQTTCTILFPILFFLILGGSVDAAEPRVLLKSASNHTDMQVQNKALILSVPLTLDACKLRKSLLDFYSPKRYRWCEPIRSKK